MENQPILVTGSHRSGTTWVGKMLSLANNVQYIYECFHPNGILRSKGIFDVWFKYLTCEEDPFKQELCRIFQYNYSFSEAYSPFDKTGNFNIRNTPVRIEFYKACKHLQKTGQTPIPLLKDPIALLSTPWIRKHFNFRPIILIRHPAAFVSSLLRLNWRFDFSNFLKQKNLMDEHLNSFKDQIFNGYKDDPVREASLLWTCLHSVINTYMNHQKNWIFKRHEDLSADPIREFRELYDTLGLSYTNEIEQQISDFTTAENAGDLSDQKQIHKLKRDSKANITSWKKRLTQSQISIIKEMTTAVACNFYSADEW